LGRCAPKTGNPSSLHRRGLQAQLACDTARAQIAAVLGAQTGEIIFTSGATEANNLAVFGAAYAKRRRGGCIVATGYEHASVEASLRALEAEGFEVVRVLPGRREPSPPKHWPKRLRKDHPAERPAINNESGARIDLAKTAKLARRKSPELRIHSDAVQPLQSSHPVSTLGWTC
jgi:cysteine desulfurase